MFIVEYPGYGIYKGSPNNIQIQKDAEAVYNFLVKDRSIPKSQILIFGRSIGSGPATWLASKYKIGGLVLISPFTSM